MRIKTWLTALAILLLGLVPLFASTQASATAVHKITLCHATSSKTNPYVSVTVDFNSVAFQGHNTHEDDIIPPFSNYAGKNWPSGQAIFNNDCHIPSTTTTTEAPCNPTTTTAAPTTTSLPPSTTTIQPATSTTTVSSTSTSTTLKATTTTDLVTSTTIPSVTSSVPTSSTTTSTTSGPSTTSTIPATTSTSVSPTSPTSPTSTSTTLLAKVTTTSSTTSVVPVTTTTIASDPPTLAKTGADLSIWLLAGVNLVGIGLLILLATRKIRK